jgi:RNA 3'-terminal phosphate cyclase-like protein
MALRYEGCAQFRQRIVAATLSQKSLRIDKIRDQDDSPGLHDFEANFLRLIEKITDGKVSFMLLLHFGEL